MVTTLVRQHFLAVVGTSGCGKSSLVKAGLIPFLHDPDVRVGDSDRDWAELVTRPGGGPFENLARALVSSSETAVPIELASVERRLRSGSNGLIDAVFSVPGMAHRNVLVVIDQFEEIFRFGDTSHRSITELERTSQHDDALAFVDTLLSAIEKKHPQIFIAITMRSDSLGRCEMFEGLPEADYSLPVPAATHDESRSCWMRSADHWNFSTAACR